MAFEKFTKYGESFSAKASVRWNGQLSINKGAINRFNLEKYKFLVLYFDKDNDLIGIKPMNEEEVGAVSIKVRKENITLSAKSFLEFYGIKHDKTRSFPVEWSEENGMIVLDLKKAASKETAF